MRVTIRDVKVICCAPQKINLVTVKVETSEPGLYGVGCATFAHRHLAVVAAVEKYLKPYLIGRDVSDIEDIWQSIKGMSYWRNGPVLNNALSGVDTALWDIKGKLVNLPISDLFGDRRERVLTYANVGHQLVPEKLGEKALEYVKKGHTAIKIRGSKTAVSLKESTMRVQAVREAIGPDVKLLVDVNGTWDADTAIQQLKEWEPYNVYWLEEPVAPEDIPGYIRVRERAGHTYIVGGEQNSGLNEFRQLINSKAVDIIQPNASATGGITEWLKIYNFASAFNIPVAPWNLQQIHMPLAVGLHNVKWIEYFTPDRTSFQNALIKKPLFKEEIDEEGVFLVASNAPGLGLEIDEEVAEETLVRE